MSLYGCVQLYLMQIPYDPISDYCYCTTPTTSSTTTTAAAITTTATNISLDQLRLRKSQQFPLPERWKIATWKMLPGPQSQ